MASLLPAEEQAAAADVGFGLSDLRPACGRRGALAGQVAAARARPMRSEDRVRAHLAARRLDKAHVGLASIWRELNYACVDRCDHSPAPIFVARGEVVAAWQCTRRAIDVLDKAAKEGGGAAC